MSDPLFIVVDLFCGFGGTTRGFALARLNDANIARVIACVNHDPKAIKSHWLNNPDVKHFEEDIRTLDLTELVALVAYYRRKYPRAKLILWASLECTNFSKAKGGLPRDADSRTLADHLDRYIIAIDPDYVKIENVVEFMSWGPLDGKGKPISRRNGEDWMRWRKSICGLGYSDEWREMNSANYGAYTSRNRLFGSFAKDGLPLAWPSPTHAKNPSIASMHGDLKKWKAVRDVLNFQDEGESIFTREKPLVDATLERIYAGLVKFVSKGDTEPFIMPTAYQNQPKYVDDPAPTITASRHHHYLINPSWGGNPGNVDEPCCTVIARQDKAPLYFVRVEKGSVEIAIYDTDSEPMIRIKQFMAAYGLVDIKMRMLRVSELLRIQGFPDTYQMVGNQSDQKKFIGNSVVPHVVKAWCEALGQRLLEFDKKVA
jgi:DNA (cytosine-5)-methyltransferase 1